LSLSEPAARLSGATTITLSALVGLLTSGAGALVNYGMLSADVRHVREIASELRDDQKAAATQSENTRDRVARLEERMSGIDQTLGRIEGKVDKLGAGAAPAVYRRVAR
jgi:hypothetical protein